VVGWYQDRTGIYGFYWDGTNYTSINFPGNSGGTLAEGINNAGVISGEYLTNQAGEAHGFTLANGVFTSYDYPGEDGLTNGMGINNNGDLTGFYNFGPNHGFLDINGSFSSFDYPGATDTFPHALNDSNHIVGYWRINANSPEGFLDANGSFTLIEYPNDETTYAAGINNAGVVVGYSTILDYPYSVAWLWQNGTFTAINSSATPEPSGINNNGQIVGVYFPGGNYLGFLATPTSAPPPLQFYPVIPCRIVDTRNANGQFGGPPISGGNSRSFPLLQGSCDLPSNAAAYSLNVTLVPINHDPVGYLTIWPTGQTQPTVSTMNSLDGRVKANAAIVPGGTGEAVSVYVTDTTNVVIDIDGYFETPSSETYAFHSLTPCRVADTRKSNFPQGLGTPHLSAGVARDFPVLNSTCISASDNAVAYSLNLTAIPYPQLGDQLGYLEIWPTGYQPPSPVSTLNNPTGTYVANAAIVAAPPSGSITAYASSYTDLAIDINGYFSQNSTGALSLYPSSPCRVYDSRHVGSGQPFSGTLNPPVDVVTSPCGIPATAQAYVFNATVVPSPTLSYLTLWPDGEGQPVVSTLNAADGWITSNMAIVPNNGDGKIDAYASGVTQLILDISSYFAP
jgi:probable HAF family extracellular repeat protein